MVEENHPHKNTKPLPHKNFTPQNDFTLVFNKIIIDNNSSSSSKYSIQQPSQYILIIIVILSFSTKQSQI